jgi:hypothetical protein
MKKQKPVVEYTGEAVFNQLPLLEHHYEQFGEYADEHGMVTYAVVWAQDHPKLGSGEVRTSVVLKRYKNGNFDTLNTKYKKVLDKKK